MRFCAITVSEKYVFIHAWGVGDFPVLSSKEKSGIEPFVAHVSESQRCYESICSFLAWDVFGIKKEK